MITDVASVKGNLRDAAIEAVGQMPPQLVLGHPIAGSERSGVDASSADLFVDHRVILTPVKAMTRPPWSWCAYVGEHRGRGGGHGGGGA